MFRHLVKDDGGQDLIEYALLAGLIAVGCVGVLTLLADPVGGLYSTILAMVESLS